MEAWIYWAIVAIVAIAAAMQARPPKTKRPSLEDFAIPRVNQGEPIPMVFGTNTLTGPMVVWYGDLLVQTETEDGFRSRTFYMGLHFILCHGPVDKFIKIIAGDREAWSGNVTESSTITIASPLLFGGHQQSGGIAGDADLMFGEATQGTNAYLTDVQGTPQPAYRGVVSVVYNQVEVSANATHVEPHGFKLSRIFSGWLDDECWYPETAEISGGVPVAEHFDDGLGAYSTLNGSAAYFNIVSTEYGNALNASNAIPADPYPSIIRDITPAPYTRISFRFKIVDVGLFGNDTTFLIIYFTDGSFLQFTPRRELGVDPFQFPRMITPSNGGGTALAGGTLATGVWYQATLTITPDAGTCTVDLSVYGGSLVQSTVVFMSGSGDIDGLGFAGAVDGGDPPARCYWDEVLFSEPAGYMNPAHIIYQAITDPMGMGLPTALIDDDSFRYAADVFFEEGLGLCLKWMQSEKLEEFIQHICDHAACVLRVSPRTGKFQLKPLRFDYDPDTLTVYDEDQITEIEQWERIGYGELVGEVTVTFRDVDTNKDGAVTRQNLAVIQSQSGVVAESIDLPGIPTESIADRVCMRELKARSVPLARTKFKTNRESWEVLPGDVFKLSWDKLGLTEVIMRCVAISTGTLTDGTITIEAAEDVFGMPASTYAASQGSGWVDPEIVDPDEDEEFVRMEDDGVTVRRQVSGTIRITG